MDFYLELDKNIYVVPSVIFQLKLTRCHCGLIFDCLLSSGILFNWDCVSLGRYELLLLQLVNDDKNLVVIKLLTV